nr:hypothetical protein Q903MT_gene783 [Picea sitchensis]
MRTSHLLTFRCQVSHLLVPLICGQASHSSSPVGRACLRILSLQSSVLSHPLPVGRACLRILSFQILIYVITQSKN